MKTTAVAEPGSQPRASFVEHCSFEITARSLSELSAATRFLRRGTELFVANMPNDPPATLVAACGAVRKAGYVPVPHIVARNLASRADLVALVEQLASEAQVDRALILGGDRDEPRGALTSALDVLQSGDLRQRGLRSIFLACYPERHPRIPDAVLRAALAEKIAAAEAQGIGVTLVSQFAFDAEPIAAMIRNLRGDGIAAPVRVGLAGRISRTKLIRYALRCGVGPSIRILRDRKDLAMSMLSAEAPDGIVDQLAAANAHDPRVAPEGIHLFTFGALADSAQWALSRQGSPS